MPFVLTWFLPTKPSRIRSIVRWRLPRPSHSGRSGERTTVSTAEYREVIHESLVVLKALTYAPTGGIVAAPTTSLPKRLAGSATGTTAIAGCAMPA